jgi:hypothetical protein
VCAENSDSNILVTPITRWPASQQAVNFSKRDGIHLSVFDAGQAENGATTSMPQELLFELKDARVTPHIATFGGTSYQIASIGSVHMRDAKDLIRWLSSFFSLG